MDWLDGLYLLAAGVSLSFLALLFLAARDDRRNRDVDRRREIRESLVIEPRRGVVVFRPGRGK